jgi:hypothetical protein
VKGSRPIDWCAARFVVEQNGGIVEGGGDGFVKGFVDGLAGADCGADGSGLREDEGSVGSGEDAGSADKGSTDEV